MFQEHLLYFTSSRLIILQIKSATIAGFCVIHLIIYKRIDNCKELFNCEQINSTFSCCCNFFVSLLLSPFSQAEMCFPAFVAWNSNLIRKPKIANKPNYIGPLAIQCKDIYRQIRQIFVVHSKTTWFRLVLLCYFFFSHQWLVIAPLMLDRSRTLFKP